MMLLAAQGFKCQLEQYRIIDLLGEGSSSEVWLVKHKRTKESFALKLLFGHLLSAHDRERIKNEIDILTKGKKCDAIVHLKESFVTEEGDQCIVMEYMPDGDLQNQMALRNFEPFTEDATRYVVRQILTALAFLHKNHIIHGDIKLENVVLQAKIGGCVAKLADFGISEPISSTQESNRIVGTQGYIAPEILKCEGYGTASDIWSLGCLIYAMLTAQLYGGAMSQKVPTDGTDLDRLEVSPVCRDLISKLLKIDPDQRPSIQEVIEHPFFN